MSKRFITAIKILNRIKISTTARILYQELACECVGGSELVYVDMPALAESLQRGIDTIRKAIKELVSLGLFETTENTVQRKCKLFKIQFGVAKKVVKEQKVEAKAEPVQPSKTIVSKTNDTKDVRDVKDFKNIKDMALKSDQEILEIAATAPQASKLDRPTDSTEIQIKFINDCENIINLMATYGVRTSIGLHLLKRYGLKHCIEVFRCYERERCEQRFKFDLERERYFRERVELMEFDERYQKEKAEGKEKLSNDGVVVQATLNS